MANPQKEEGHTAINHETLEALLRWRGPGRVKDFVLAVARETWGYSESERKVTLKRFADLMGVTPPRVSKVRQIAFDCKLVEQVNGRYRVQKNHEEWLTPEPLPPCEERNDRIQNLRGRVRTAQGEDALRTKRGGEEKINPPIDPKTKKKEREAEEHLPEDFEPTDELCIQAACGRLEGSLKRHRQWWTTDLLEAARDKKTPLTDDEIIAALANDGPGMSEKPKSWLQRIIGKKMAGQRAQAGPTKPKSQFDYEMEKRDRERGVQA